MACCSAAAGRLSSHVAWLRLSPAGSRSAPGHSACTSSGRPSADSTGMTSSRSFSLTCGNSSTPDGQRKHLKPSTPAAASGSRWSTLPGTTPPQNATSTWHSRAAARRFVSSASTDVVAGTLLSGMSTIVVTPPAAAARVACTKPSQSVRPGSLTCTWESTRPGRTTRSPASMTPLMTCGACALSVIAVIRPSRISMSTARTPSGRTTFRLRRMVMLPRTHQRAIVASISPYGSSVGTKTSFRLARPKRDRSTGR